jgi:ABC-type transport system involved in multi-copper enzyme maturation permease subunit
VIAKELRALFPALAAASAAIGSCALLRDLYPFGVPAYFIGAATLGALTMGHEYSHRTLPFLLTLPVSRHRVLLTKLVALGTSLLLLAMLRSVLPVPREALIFRGTVIWLPFFAALFVTPYLTIVSRSPVGGAVFTLAIAGVLMIAGEWIGIGKYGYTREVDSFRVVFVWYALALLAAASAAGAWWTFARLQVFEAGEKALDLAPRTVTTSRVLVRRNPTWLLVKKELRLQQLAFAVAAIYVVAFVAIAVAGPGAIPKTMVVSQFYAPLLTLLIGATASAEERHLRTLDAQLLLPMELWRQWLIKVAVVLVLTVLLALVLPGVLMLTFTTQQFGLSLIQTLFFPRAILMLLLALSALSLYVSTLCSNGLWALMVSVPSGFALAVFVLKLANDLQAFLYWLGGRPDWRLVDRTETIMSFVMIVVILRLAEANHCTTDRSRLRTAIQVAIAAGSAVAAAGVIAAVASLSR